MRGGEGTRLILNPRAGGGVDDEAWASELGDRLGAEVLTPTSAAETRRRVAEAVNDGCKRVVAAGGDGTVREVVRVLADAASDGRTVPILAVLPLGTGNDLARSLGMPADADEAVAHLAGSPRTRPLDVLRVVVDGVSDWAVNAVVVGEGGRVGRVLDDAAKAFWGPLSYLRSAVEVAAELSPLAVRLDGAADACSVLNVVAANGATAAGGVPIAPGASLHDGRLDRVVVLECGWADVLRIGAGLVRGLDPDVGAYGRTGAQRVKIEAAGEPDLPVSVDGENGMARTVEVAIEPGLLRVQIGP